MRVGVTCFGERFGTTGGVQVYRRELIRALERYDPSGNQYTLLFAPFDEMPLVHDPRRFAAVRLERPAGRPTGPWRQRLLKVARLVGALPRAADPFSRQIDRLGLDVIHYPATRMEELSLTTPTVLTFFDMQEEFLPTFFPLRERLGRRTSHRAAVKKARVVIAPSEFTARSLETVYGTDSSKISRIPVGIPDGFNPTVEQGERERLGARYRIPVGDFLFYPANPWPHKNHARLLAALRRFGQRKARARPLVCTGRLQDEKRSVRALAEAAGLEKEQVYDLGFVPEEDMPALYRAARMLVFPSLFEGYGMPLLEALACGCPVACSNATSLPELGGDAVRYFDPLNEDAMIEAIDEVGEDGQLRSRLIERGMSRCRDYRWEKVVPLVLQTYARAAALPEVG